MKNVLSYKGFQGTVDYSPEDEYLGGKVLGVPDLIVFESTDARGIRKAFEKAVDHYIETCKAVGKKPLKSYTGTLNVRLRPETHLKAAIKAESQGKSINRLINEAVEKEVGKITIPE